jgi:hypothetical protein
MINLADLQLWQPPWNTNGSASLIRVSSSALKNVTGSCAVEKVAKAYVGLYTEARDWSQRKDPRAVFLLGAARTVLAAQRTPANLAEVIAAELGADATEPSLLAAKTMVQNALNATEDFAAEDLAVDQVMQPTADFVCVATTDNQRLELTSWGVFYQSVDRTIRELRLFCYRDAQTARDKNQLIAAVNILLNGAITDGPIARWTEHTRRCQLIPRSELECDKLVAWIVQLPHFLMGMRHLRRHLLAEFQPLCKIFYWLLNFNQAITVLSVGFELVALQL